MNVAILSYNIFMKHCIIGNVKSAKRLLKKYQDVIILLVHVAISFVIFVEENGGTPIFAIIQMENLLQKLLIVSVCVFNVNVVNVVNSVMIAAMIVENNVRNVVIDA